MLLGMFFQHVRNWEERKKRLNSSVHAFPRESFFLIFFFFLVLGCFFYLYFTLFYIFITFYLPSLIFSHAQMGQMSLPFFGKVSKLRRWWKNIYKVVFRVFAFLTIKASVSHYMYHRINRHGQTSRFLSLLRRPWVRMLEITLLCEVNWQCWLRLFLGLTHN